MKLYYVPDVLGRYIGLLKTYDHVEGNIGYFTYSFGFWWIELEFTKKQYKYW